MVALRAAVVAWLVLQLVAGDGAEDGELVLRLQHSFDMGSTWSERGSVNVHSTRSGSASVDQAPLDAAQRRQLQDLCRAGSLYLVLASQAGGPGALRSYTSACGLLEAGLQDTLTLQLDWRGKLVAASLGLQLPAGGAARGAGLETTGGSTFQTRVSAQTMEAGPTPDTAAFIQRVEENKRATEKGEVKDNRSFLAKYWMYIVPVVLFMALNGAASPPA